MTDIREELEARAAEDGIEFFLTMFVDMHGRPCAKLVPSSAMDVVVGGAGFAGFAVGPMGQSPADPDMIAAPDPASYVKLPWQRRRRRADVRHRGRGQAVAVHAEGDAAQHVGAAA